MKSEREQREKQRRGWVWVSQYLPGSLVLCPQGPSPLLPIHSWKQSCLHRGPLGFVPFVLVFTLLWFAGWSRIPILLLTFLLFTKESKMKHLEDEYLDKDTEGDQISWVARVVSCVHLRFPFTPSLLTYTSSQVFARQWLSPLLERKSDQEHKDKCKIKSWLQT